MADEPKKLTTAEILAQARAQAKAKAEGASAESAPAPADEPPATPSQPAPPAAAPKSTADILAAARAQAAAKKEAGDKPAAPASGAPKSTADILAAARAQAKGGATAPAASAAPAAKKPAAKAAAATGDLPPVEEMIKAMKGDAPAVKAAPAKPERPPMPTRPAAKAKAPDPPRRNFLVGLVATPFALAWTLLTLSTTWFSLYVARFMMPNYLIEPPSKFKIGPASDYGFGTVSTKWTSEFGVWIVHTEWQGKRMIYALASVCTHLGCTPNWLEGEQKFKCPCHGSGFYISGINFEGPAPRPLERVGLALSPDGALEVDKSVKFQEELGQWNDDKSFVVA